LLFLGVPVMFFVAFLKWGIMISLLLSLGCATAQSDLPWNTPPSWQGTPQIPGLSGTDAGP